MKVGITGGIGTGKSTVAKVFETLGIPVFRADDAAKYLMDHDLDLREAVIGLLGDVYTNGTTDRAKISAIVFRDPTLLEQLNALVHPATIAYGRQWMEAQISPYILKEAAIFFESGSNREIDFMIGVSAPAELRIRRVEQRSKMPRNKVLEIMASQMDNDAKLQLCDAVIVNDDIQPVLPQVLLIHDTLLQLSKQHVTAKQ